MKFRSYFTYRGINLIVITYWNIMGRELFIEVSILSYSGPIEDILKKKYTHTKINPEFGFKYYRAGVKSLNDLKILLKFLQEKGFQSDEAGIRFKARIIRLKHADAADYKLYENVETCMLELNNDFF